MITFFRVFLVFSLLIITLPGTSSYAQEGMGNEAQSAQNSEDSTGNAEDGGDRVTDEPDVRIFKDSEYRRATFKNMSKLFWYFDLGDINNDEHIDFFMRINECELFEKYYGNEFEWTPLRATIREYLDINRKNFSKQLYFSIPIEVGSYNLKKEHFPVLSKNFNSVQREFFPTPTLLDWTGYFCGSKVPDDLEKVYPHEVVFRLIRPMNIQNVKVGETAARQLVDEWLKRGSERRYLYIRVYFNITKFMGYKKYSTYVNPPVFMTYLDGYEIFADPTMQNKLDGKNYIRKKKDNSDSLPSTNELDNQTQDGSVNNDIPDKPKKDMSSIEKSLEGFDE